MHVYQPFDLVLGLAMFLLGLIGSVRDLYRVFSRTFTNGYEDWRSIGLSLWFLFAGPTHLSRAFDPPHLESHRTSVLEAVALPVMSLILAAGMFAWIVRRRQKAQEGEAILEQRAAWGDWARSDQALAKVGAVPPDEHDRL